MVLSLVHGTFRVDRSNNPSSPKANLVLALYDEGNLADDRDLKAYAMNYGIEVDSLESLSS
jgi:hypothetical protein